MSGHQRLQARPVNCSVRRAGAGDLPALSVLRARMFATFCATDLAALAGADEAFFGPALARGEAAAWLAEDEAGRPVACGAATVCRLPPKPFALGGLYVYVSSMWTEPEHRRRGLGGKLLDAALEYARGLGAEHVFLHATDAGRPLYASRGFAGTNEMRLAL